MGESNGINEGAASKASHAGIEASDRFSITCSAREMYGSLTDFDLSP